MVDTIPEAEFRKIFERYHRTVNLSRVRDAVDIENRMRKHPKYDKKTETLIAHGFALKVVAIANARPNSHIGRVVRGLVGVKIRPPTLIRMETWEIKGTMVKREVTRYPKGTKIKGKNVGGQFARKGGD